MSDNHIRLNKVTREWVIYAPARQWRPQHKPAAAASALPECDPGCPFCTFPNPDEPILLELAAADGSTWQTRVVPNKFPALTPEGDRDRQTTGIYLSAPGYGRHEVIVESPKHNDDLATMPLAAVERVIETYHRRYLELMALHESVMAIIFRNHGARAGASLAHPHSQIVATCVVPQHIRAAGREAQRYYDERAHCLYCDILAFELAEGRRLVATNRSFVAFVPFAADVPFEVWIIPRRHQADFGSISEAEKADFAAILQLVLYRLYVKLGNPDYNYAINTAPRYKAEEPQDHWYCRIRPCLTTPAGFELGAGISINPSLPERDAAFLRQDSDEAAAE